MTSRNPMERSAMESKSFFAVLDHTGNLVDTDADADEAYARAQHASPTGTVVVDGAVFGEPERTQNPAGKLANAAQKALVACRVPALSFSANDWASFDPVNNQKDAAQVEAARDVLRKWGRKEYASILESVKGEVYRPQEEGEKGKRGGIAREFSAGWLVGDFLRQNQKMAKILEGEDVMHDSIGLSLLPHGASFRDPFSTSTEQGAGGATNCLFSTAECRKVCLVNTGQRALESGAFASSYLFSKMLRENPDAFAINVFDRCIQAFLDTDKEGRRAYAEKFRESAPLDMRFNRFIRLNVLSDLPWELLAPGMIESICRLGRRMLQPNKRHVARDGLMFYDYTKIPYRRGLPDLYDLTMSFSGSAGLFDALFDVINGDPEAAPRAAVVFVQREEKPAHGRYGTSMYRAAPGKPLSSKQEWHSWEFLGQRVWNGDLSDVRPLDPKGVRIVGLTYKPPNYKVAAPVGAKKKFALEAVVPATDIDRELPTFLVRVRQPDPDAPPIVMATQDPDNRKLVLPTVSELESML